MSDDTKAQDIADAFKPFATQGKSNMINGDHPAFPCGYDDTYGSHMTGMSIRVEIAKAMMQGLLANPGGPIQANGMSGWAFCNCKIEDVAALAVGAADALIAELSKPKGAS
jgi:hypothetical protein